MSKLTDTLKSYIKLCEANHILSDGDGCDYAYINGLKDILGNIGDGGITEAYFNGLKYGLEMYDELCDQTDGD